MVENQPRTDLNKITEEDEYLEQNSNENNFQMIKQIPDTGIDENCEEYTRVYTYEDEKKETVCGVDFFYKCGYLNDQPIFNKISVSLEKKNLDLSQCKTTEDIIKKICSIYKTVNCDLHICTFEQIKELEQEAKIGFITSTKLPELFFKGINEHFSKAAKTNNKHFIYPFIKFLSKECSFDKENIEEYIGVFQNIYNNIISIAYGTKDNNLSMEIAQKIRDIISTIKQDNEIYYNFEGIIKNELEGILSLIDESTSKTTNNDSIECGCNLRSCLSCCKIF
jgi:hypothetical protein